MAWISADCLRLGFARHRAALDLQRARGGVRAQAAAAAAASRRAARAAPPAGAAAARAGRAPASLSSAEEVAHLHIGVDAELELAAVRRAPGHLHFDPQIALVRQADFERGGLGDDGAIHFACA